MEEEKHEGEGQDKEEDKADENESKVLEQVNNNKKKVLKNQATLFLQEESLEWIQQIFGIVLESFTEFFTYVAQDNFSSKTSRHKRNLSFGGGGSSKNMIPAKYNTEPVIRVLVARMLKWFNIFLTFQSESIDKSLTELEILKDIVTI